MSRVVFFWSRNGKSERRVSRYVSVKTRLQSVFLLAHLRLLIHDYIENLPDKVLAFPSVVDGTADL